MIIIPAIDLHNQRVVRLRQGEAEAMTQFSTDPAGVAQFWAEAGASWIHVVDLDGAFAGSPQQLDAVARIASAVDIPLQLGGGIRGEADINAAFKAGATRVVIGSIAATNAGLTKRLIATYGERLAIAIDVRGNAVRVAGWTKDSSWTPSQLMTRPYRAGASRFIVTDITRDGMLNGPNPRLLAEISKDIDCPLIASGGIESLENLRNLATSSVEAAIIGMALYKRRFTLPEAIAAARRTPC